MAIKAIEIRQQERSYVRDMIASILADGNWRTTPQIYARFITNHQASVGDALEKFVTDFIRRTARVPIPDEISATVALPKKRTIVEMLKALAFVEALEERNDGRAISYRLPNGIPTTTANTHVDMSPDFNDADDIVRALRSVGVHCHIAENNGNVFVAIPLKDAGDLVAYVLEMTPIITGADQDIDNIAEPVDFAEKATRHVAKPRAVKVATRRGA